MSEEQKERDWIEHMTDSQREEYLKSKNKLYEIITGATEPIIKNDNTEAPRMGLCRCGHTFSFHNWSCQAEGCKCQKSFDELLIDENNALRARLEMAKERLAEAQYGMVGGNIANELSTPKIIDDWLKYIGEALK